MASALTRGLRGDNETPAPAKMFPQWREVEQDFWLDMFESYSQALLDQNPEEDADKLRHASERETYLIDKIKTAALLADEATKEMIYRFERQKPIRNQRRSSGGGGGERSRKKSPRRSW